MAGVRIAGFGKSVTKPVKELVPYSCRDRIQPSCRSQFSARPLRGVDPMGLIDSLQPAPGQAGLSSAQGALYSWNGPKTQRFQVT